MSCTRSRLRRNLPLTRFEHSTGHSARATAHVEANCFPVRPRRTCSRGLKQHTGDMILGHISGRGSCIVKAWDGLAGGGLGVLGQRYWLEFLSLDLSKTDISQDSEACHAMVLTQIFGTIIHTCTRLTYRVNLENYFVRGWLQDEVYSVPFNDTFPSDF